MYALFVLLAAPIILQLIYPISTMLLDRFWGRERLTPVDNKKEPHFACIITAYRNADIARPLTASLLQQSYPHLTIYLVADECPETPIEPTDPRLVYLRPESPLRLKAKSIIYAVERFRHSHDYIVVFDADNLAHPRFLEVMVEYIRAGHRCIQGRRCAKNLDSNYAALDSLGEHYKNYIERQVPYRLGASAVISGSGMATEAELYQAYLNSPEIQQGKHMWKKMLQEDKILQNFIVRCGGKIAFARRAVVYDEKVDNGQAVETQRSRWLFSYFQNLPNAFGLLLRGFSGDFNSGYFGWITLALPMFLQLASATLLALAGWWIAPAWSIALVAAMGLFALGVIWALGLDEAPPPVWRALWQAPRFVLRQARGLLKMRDPNKHFKHTETSKKISVEELLGEKRQG